MKYAPVIVTTLNRDEHFIRLIESLRKNTWASYTDVYVAVDYPPNDNYAIGYKKICAYLSNPFLEFNKFIVIKREYNYGSIKNMDALRSYILERYDRFIRTDDDAEFSPNFLEYMNKCLDKYQDDESVIAVTGYSYPVKWKVSEGSNVFLQNFSCPMWGTGFWKRSFCEAEAFIADDGLRKTTKGMNNMLEVSLYEYLNLCLTSSYDYSLASRMSDISVRMYMALSEKYVAVPVVSKVRNWGFDGSGVYCPEVVRKNGKQTAYNYDYRSQEIDNDNSFTLSEDTSGDVVANKRILNSFDALPLKSKIRLYVKLVLLKFLGVRNYVKLFS